LLWTALLDRTKHRKIIFYDNDETRTFRFTRRKRNATFSIAVSVVSFFRLYCGAISQFSLVCLSVCTQLAIFVRFCTRHTLVRRGTISLLFFSLSGYRYLGDGGTNRREIFHHGTYRSRTESLPSWGQCPRGTPKSQILGLNFGQYLTANISKTVSRSVTCQLQLNISSTIDFLKM